MKKAKIILLFIITIVLVSTSCQMVGKIIDPVKKERKEIVQKVYQKNGLSFSHPDNWQVTEDKMLEEGTRYINVEDSDNSLFIITLVNSDSYVDLEAYAENFKNSLPSSVAIGKIIHASTTETNRIIKGQNNKGIRQKYSITIATETVPHTTDFFSIDGEKLNGVIMIQAPDEDWKAAEKEFQVIFDSLKF